MERRLTCEGPTAPQSGTCSVYRFGNRVASCRRTIHRLAHRDGGHCGLCHGFSLERLAPRTLVPTLATGPHSGGAAGNIRRRAVVTGRYDGGHCQANV